MTIEEAIKILDRSANLHLAVEREPNKFDIAIKTLLSAYEKEKEKNKEIEEITGLWINASNNVTEITQTIINQNYVSKDKIKAKIEEYEKQEKEEPDAYLCKKVLQSLLEEKE